MTIKYLSFRTLLWAATAEISNAAAFLSVTVHWLCECQFTDVSYGRVCVYTIWNITPCLRHVRVIIIIIICSQSVNSTCVYHSGRLPRDDWSARARYSCIAFLCGTLARIMRGPRGDCIIKFSIYREPRVHGFRLCVDNFFTQTMYNTTKSITNNFFIILLFTLCQRLSNYHGKVMTWAGDFW